MIGQIKKFRHFTTRHLFAMRVWFGAFAACFVAAASLVTPALIATMALVATPALAASGDRTLNLFYTHTGQSAKITFRRNGRYDQAGLNKLDKFLRDWRRNESIRMDPALFDLVWQVYQDVGAKGPIHVVSAYRSPQTNAMLRSRSRAVAKESRHIKGQAMDFFIPGIPIEKLREAAMRRQVGGVGYYPTSNSPFVHLDTGNVRAWPRMTRAQLKRLFPNGRTLHLPTDGIPISRKGRLYASAQWNKCKSVPCYGSASNTAPSGNRNSGGSGRTLLDMFFGNNQSGSQTIQVASNGPGQRKVTSVRVAARQEIPPVPAPRPALLALRDQITPPIPAQMPQTLLVATKENRQTQNSTSPLDNSHPPAGQANRPKPGILLSRNFGTSTFLTAYAPTSKPEPNAQRALQMLIERRNSSPSIAATPAAPLDQSQKIHPSPESKPALRGSISVASIGGVPGLGVNQAVSLFDATWNAVNKVRSHQQIDPIVTGAIPSVSDISLLPIKMRPIKLVAPDLENVADAMVAPARISGAHFAVMFEPDEGDFSPATELGPLMGQINFKLSAFSNLKTSRFTLKAPQLITAL